MRTGFIILLAALLFGCATTQPVIDQPIEQKPEPSVEYKAFWDSKPEGKEWTQFTVDALGKYGQGLLNLSNPSDANAYCPKFKSLNIEQKTQVWVTLISAMAKRESNFKPETSYKEGFNDSKGNPVISRGLLQISKESANQSAYGCKIVNESELHDPKTNINCGILILSKWVPQDNAIGTKKLGGARYWSVLRDTSETSQAYIRSQTKSLSFCN